MKITQKRLNFVSGLLVLIGLIVGIVTKPSVAGKYASIGIIITGLVLLAPWVKDKDVK